jgi:hypothetical protein
MKESIKVVMQPTEDITDTNVFKYTDSFGDEGIFLNKEGYRSNHQNFHLHVTVSNDVEPIKEGDWYINTEEKNGAKNPFYGKLYRANESIHTVSSTYIQNLRKITATTDSKLTIPYMIDGHSGLRQREANGVLQVKLLPQVQQSFLKEFVANPDGEYEVEYYIPNSQFSVFSDNKSDNYYHGLGIVGETLKLKLNQDNTVNITSVEEWKPKNGEQVWIKVFSNWSSGSYIGLDLGGKKHIVRSPKETGGQLMVSDKILPITATPNKKNDSVENKMYSKEEYIDGLMRLAGSLYPSKSDDEGNMKLFMANWIPGNL